MQIEPVKNAYFSVSLKRAKILKVIATILGRSFRENLECSELY